jgi:dihydroorotase
MKILIKKATIVHEGSRFHLTQKDVLVIDGKICEIADHIESQGEHHRYESPNLHVSVGWVDFSVHYKDPGAEWLENLESLQRAAQKGGFTEIVGFPNTQPTVQTKESMAYFQQFSERKLVQFHNFGAVTKNCEGKDFTDMMDLHSHGAVGFSDGIHPLESSDILLKSLQYLFPLQAILVNKSQDKYLNMFGQMHEGKASTMLGLKGMPAASEELMIMRDLKLLAYAQLRSDKPLLHFSTISTAESVQLIRRAKAEGLAVSCDVAAHQLVFTDEDLVDFDTFLKVKPPFRAKSDIEALKEGLRDGTIDTVVSDHNPLDAELKNLEFDLAEFGVLGLQTSFAVVNTYSGLALEALVAKLTHVPRQLMRKEMPTIEVGQVANLTVFDPSLEFVFEEKDIVSLSKNSPFIGKTLKGRPMGVINNHFNQPV